MNQQRLLRLCHCTRPSKSGLGKTDSPALSRLWMGRTDTTARSRHRPCVQESMNELCCGCVCISRERADLGALFNPVPACFDEAMERVTCSRWTIHLRNRCMGLAPVATGSTPVHCDQNDAIGIRPRGSGPDGSILSGILVHARIASSNAPDPMRSPRRTDSTDNVDSAFPARGSAPANAPDEGA